MTPTRPSLWERKRSAWYRDSARSQIAEAAGWLMILFGLGALVLGGYALTRLPTVGGWSALTASLLCGAALYGLRTGKAWSRWIGGGVAGAIFFVQLAALLTAVMTGAEGTPRQWITGVLFTWMWGLAMYSLLRPGARDVFRRAREGVSDDEPQSARAADLPRSHR